MKKDEKRRYGVEGGKGQGSFATEKRAAKLKRKDSFVSSETCQKNKWKLNFFSSHQWMSEFGGVVVVVCDGDGGRRRSSEANFTSCHVFGHDLQLVRRCRQRLEKRG